jgi:hypothetical protein
LACDGDVVVVVDVVVVDVVVVVEVDVDVFVFAVGFTVVVVVVVGVVDFRWEPGSEPFLLEPLPFVLPLPGRVVGVVSWVSSDVVGGLAMVVVGAPVAGVPPRIPPVVANDPETDVAGAALVDGTTTGGAGPETGGAVGEACDPDVVDEPALRDVGPWSWARATKKA